MFPAKEVQIALAESSQKAELLITKFKNLNKKMASK
jgi:hypothetical protein